MSGGSRRRTGLLFFFLICLAALLLLNRRWLWRPFYPIHYQAELARESRRNGLDPFLVAAITRTESGWRPNAVSARGAIGLMQIMPDTGRWVADQIGLRDFTEESLFDPEINLRIGCWYIAELSRQFKGDRILILAAYNAGRGNVSEWLRSERWSGEAESVGDIPFEETRNFITRVLNARSRLVWIYGPGYFAVD
ncbi:MAG: lytic transglycosylase domain-containing protein [Chloroflexota bacterium]